MIQVVLNKVRDCVSIMEHKHGIGSYAINIAPLTEEQEEILDRGNEIIAVYDDIKYTIRPTSVIAYGEIDLNFDSDDVNTLDEFDLMRDANMPCYLPSLFNYEKSCTYKDNKREDYKYTETYDTITVLRYKHCIIGKPKRIIIFRKQL